MASRLPLDTLIELARNSTDEAARALGELNGRRDTAERQLALLRDYRQDYLEKLQAALETGLAAADCHNYQRFISTLDDAIDQQTQLLEHVERQLAAGREHWQQQKRKLNSFDALLTREQRAQAVIESRREQRANDEYSARLFHRNGHAHAY